ncbi:MAG TPA: GDSL-type esterase/lipase family protein [Spirochaetales bacterium]|nr:GDSL-type esterase/lipase family protein [Spirochaetales bacterium]
MLSFVLLSVLLGTVFLALLVSLALSLSRARIELPASAPELLLAARAAGGAARTVGGNAEAAGTAEAAGAGGPPRKPLAVCLGDSITHGVVSANYVDMLASRLPDWEFSNGGVNSELAYNVASRLDPVVALEPDAVTVLIGTNDVNATFGLRSLLGYWALHRLPERPSLLFFRENLAVIVRRLRRETKARVALLSMPPIGEDPGHYAWLRSEEYAEAVKEVAKAEGAEYLPLRERIVAYLDSVPRGRAIPFERFGQAQGRSARSRFLYGKSFDEIAAGNGFHLLVDGIHLNTHGASMAADLVEGFLRQSRR